MEKTLYWNPNKLLSHNRILNFVIGVRGYGKTYGTKKYAMKRFLKHGEEFIYSKRYKSDLKRIDSFFKEIEEEEDFKNHTWKVYNGAFYCDDKICGYVVPLSAWQSVKSLNFNKVGTLIYDEFMLEKSKQSYMPNEPNALLNFMDTVFRNRDNGHCICLSNSVTITNPFFIYLQIIPDINRRFNKFDSVVVEVTDGKDFTDERRKTRFGQLIDGTEYGDFALDNKFVNDSHVFIEKRSKNSRFQFNVVYQGMVMGVWVDVNEGLMYLSNDHDPLTKKSFVFLKDDMEDGRTYVTNWKQNYYTLKLGRAFKNGLLRFDNQALRNIGYDMFSKLHIQ